MTWSPHITVACIVEHNHKLLFVEELSAGKAVLNQPAGHVEKGETLISAAIRETLEESACKVEIKSLLGIYTHFLEEQNMTYFRFCFIANLIEEDENGDLDPDIIQTHWIGRDEALSFEQRFRSPLVKRCLDDYFSGQSFPLTLIQEFEYE